jgi:hypothetical protein
LLITTATPTGGTNAGSVAATLAVGVAAGIGTLLLSAYPYALAAAAVVTVLLVQAIYQAGQPSVLHSALRMNVR